MSESEIQPAKDNVDFLSPLLSDPKALAKEFRLRRNPSKFQHVALSDLDAEIADGWEIHSKGKRKAKLRKLKSHDHWLEDRVWCLLYKMGYASLNGKRSVIQFERNDRSKGRKQIDVFAADNETAFVIECKSKDVRDRRSLAKDILESIALQGYVRKSIFTAYGDKPKPKIVWAYVTNNIIWSQPDIERADDGNIQIITENELQYFEAFIRHMGPAGKFQILGEFLKGQKIPGIGDVTLPAVRGHIAGETFFSFVATPRTLLRIAFINHQALNHPDGKPAYQRMISSSRIKEIEEFITHRGGYFPNNILVNFVVKPRFDLISNKDNSDPNIKFGWITLPAVYRSAWIIDGQHRLYGYSRLDDKFLDQSIFVLAFEKMDTRKEANLFITINHKQKSVPKSLLVSLLADLKLGDDDAKTALSALASAVVRAINVDKTSPLSRRFSVHGIPPESSQNLTVSEVVNGLNRSELLGRVVGKARLPGPLAGPTDEQSIDRARNVLNHYFEALRDAHPGRWAAGKDAYISVNPGIRAHLMLMAEIVDYLRHKKGVDFHTLAEGKFATYVIEVAKPVFNFVKNARDEEIREKFSRKFGEGGVKEYLYHLFTIIHEERDDFGPDEFLTWSSQQESARIDDANRFVMVLSENMIDCVVSVLKGIYGTKQTDSGDPAFWELGIDSRRVKDNAYKKQQEENRERRKSKEAYIDIVDLIEIIKQPSNWPHFEDIFNAPMPGEKKGSKFYLKWMHEFNELRKIAAHKNKLRTYKDEDLDFLDWLRTGVFQKIQAELKGR